MAQQTKIFIGCLPNNTEKEEVYLHFSKYCQIIKLKIKFRSNGVCAGYGHFRTRITDQEKAALLSAEHRYKDRKLDCRVYVKGPKLQKFLEDFTYRKIYVKNIPKGTTDLELHNYFSQLCQVQKAYIANQIQDEKDSLFGFVVTSSKEGAKKLTELAYAGFKGSKLELLKSTCKKLESMRMKREKKEAATNRKALSRKSEGRIDRTQNYLKGSQNIKLINQTLPNFKCLGKQNFRLNKGNIASRKNYYFDGLPCDRMGYYY